MNFSLELKPAATQATYTERTMAQKDDDIPRNEPLLMKFLKVFGAVVLYWSVSISMVFLNKYLLKSNLDLNAPLFVTWFQCVMTVVLCWICDYMANALPDKITFPSTKFDMKLSREALPLSVVFVSMITFNNLCLREVGVAFYTIARSLVTIFSLIFTYLILGKKTSSKALACCGMILFGFCLGVNQEASAVGSLSISGVIYGIFASAMVALNAIYIKKVLPSMDDNIWKMTYYNNVNASIIFIPLFLLTEMNEIIGFKHLYEGSFWFYMCVAGFFGFIMGYVVGLQIKITTPVTHTVSGVAKACLQTVIAVVYNEESKTILWWLSNLIVLCATGSYSIVKSMDMKAAHEREKSAVTRNSDEEKQSFLSEKKTITV